MNRYTASPTVMNEALRILREHQMVEVRREPNGVVFVAAQPPHVRLSAVQLWFHHTNVSPAWMFEMRVRVEIRAMPEAFMRITSVEIERLVECLRIMAETEDASRYLEAAFGFHHVLVQASGDELLEEMHRMLLTVLRVSRARAAFTPDADAFRTRSVDIHRQLIDALRSRDREAFTRWAHTQYETMVRAGVDVRSGERVRVGPVWAGLPEDDARPGPLRSERRDVPSAPRTGTTA